VSECAADDINLFDLYLTLWRNKLECLTRMITSALVLASGDNLALGSHTPFHLITEIIFLMQRVYLISKLSCPWLFKRNRLGFKFLKGSNGLAYCAKL
jgi:hypothetical protein